MHPDKIITLIKNHIDDFTQDQFANLLCIFSTYNDKNNIIIPLENNGIRVVQAKDIYYIHEPKKNKIFIHTEKEIIEYNSPKTNLLEYVDANNDSFRYLNNGLVVNMNVIVSYNSYYRKIYLLNNEVVDVTGTATKILEKVLGRDLDLCKNKQLNNYAY